MNYRRIILLLVILINQYIVRYGMNTQTIQREQCRCGHSRMAHLKHFAEGHGECANTKCDCPKFTWVSNSSDTQIFSNKKAENAAWFYLTNLNELNGYYSQLDVERIFKVGHGPFYKVFRHIRKEIQGNGIIK